ncbi:NIPSNAP family protein [Glycomyces artemisiae]|uniref:NIPSNAP protein n=1 Tax=Glycomyces artemisiae TaxID=1076443 RepID=A0A2T0UHF3_9ACTN|nr:NIPSNAP family protein [Glycomyces artemisiae]PRY57365.1 NIPSNAP protein [Glycomyces artemisiae]
MIPCHVYELRQYTLHPGRRDELVELFEREFIEPQEAAGMRIVGQFRDLDRPDHLVWVRGFRDMETRAAALAAFYGGPVWKAHRDAANATMLDSDDVLLLRPAYPGAGFPAPGGAEAGRFTAAVHRNEPGLADRCRRRIGPLACLETEPAENTFPALPVRTGEDVLVWFAAGDTAHDLPEPVQTLRLEPTAGSRLR